MASFGISIVMKTPCQLALSSLAAFPMLVAPEKFSSYLTFGGVKSSYVTAE